MRKRIGTAKAAVKTRIQLSEAGKHEVQVSMDGINYRTYKSGLTLDAAAKETTSIRGHYSLWNDIIDKRK